MTRAQNLRTVAQVVEECPAFSEAALRKLILRAPLNGLEPAIVRLGRRVLIDYSLFNEWLEGQRLESASGSGISRPSARRRRRNATR